MKMYVGMKKKVLKPKLLGNRGLSRCGIDEANERVRTNKVGYGGGSSPKSMRCASPPGDIGDDEVGLEENIGISPVLVVTGLPSSRSSCKSSCGDDEVKMAGRKNRTPRL